MEQNPVGDAVLDLEVWCYGCGEQYGGIRVLEGSPMHDVCPLCPGMSSGTWAEPGHQTVLVGATVVNEKGRATWEAWGCPRTKPEEVPEEDWAGVSEAATNEQDGGA